MGSGRSGTSMLAGVLAGAGYYMGSKPLAVNSRPLSERQTNPKGNFEDREINAINEALLAAHFPRRARTPLVRRYRERRVLGPQLRWASALPLPLNIERRPDLDARIAAQVRRKPFCFKDPRFCYTLPAWRDHVEGAVLLCVFREPACSANSIVTEWKRHPRRRFVMTYEKALASWRAMYRHVLEVHRHSGEWLFLHYDQVLSGEATAVLEATLGVEVDASFPERGLKRSAMDGDVGPEEEAIYGQLCGLAHGSLAEGAVA
jgi:hypothetical protein